MSLPYFELFSLSETFDVDMEQLEQQYRLFAQRYHPDKFAALSSFEQKQAMMMSATINEAYRVLKHPTDRAAYLLSLKGFDVDDPKNTQFPTEFLMQQMEWREALESAIDDNNHPKLLDLDKEIATAQAEGYQRIQSLLLSEDLEEAVLVVRQARFLDKLREEIRRHQS